MVIWAAGRFKRYAVANFFFKQSIGIVESIGIDDYLSKILSSL